MNTTYKKMGKCHTEAERMLKKLTRPRGIMDSPNICMNILGIKGTVAREHISPKRKHPLT
jgi:hypothetical protein